MGTLAWELTSDQVTHHGSGMGQKEGTNNTFTINMPVPSTFIPPGAGSAITLANTILVAIPTNSAQVGGTYSAAQNGDAMTELPNAVFRWANNTHRTTVWYRTNPDKGSSVSLNMGTQSGYNFNSALLQAGYFSNVDQTNPFSVISQGERVMHQRHRYSKHNFMYQPVPTQIGDLILVCAQGEYDQMWNIRNRGAHTICGVANHNDTDYHVNSGMFWYITPSSYEEHMLVEGHNAYQGHTSGSSSSVYAYKCFSVMNLQSPRTMTTLFTVPSGAVIKLNNVYIEDPEVSGMHVSLQVDGLPTGTTGILNASGTKIINSEGTIATTNICRFTKARSREPRSVLEKPIYMVEGDVLKAKAVCDEAYPEYEGRKVKVVVNFEVIK